MKVLGAFLEVFYRWTGSFGFSMILLTVLVKLLTVPSDIKRRKLMGKQQTIAKELEQIKLRCKDDKERLTRETAELYKKYEINPLGGCLPMILQALVMISLYFVIKKPIIYIMGIDYSEVWRIVRACNEWAISSLATGSTKVIEMLRTVDVNNFAFHEIEIARELFLHPSILDNPVITPELMKNVTLINFNFFGIDLASTPALSDIMAFFSGAGSIHSLFLFMIPFVTAITTYFSNRLMMKSQPQAPNGQQMAPATSMMWMAPILIGWTAFSVPAGLALYWITTNILQLLQQCYVDRKMSKTSVKTVVKGEVVK
jgi:YidC/Oxa1 family membrane protein insertase